MRAALPITAALSLGAHLAVAAALLAPRSSGGDPADPAPQLAGETFELPAPEAFVTAPESAPPDLGDVPASDAERASAASEDGDALREGQARREAAPPRPAPKRSAPARAARAEPGGDDGATGGAAALYGAVGERSAADLATAFTRGFPQAASADPLWRSAPLGAAGEAELLLTLDDAGHIASSEVLGQPSPALASAIRRTLALVGSRAFVAKGKTTRLHLSARVSADAVHDGLHGDVFAIGGSFVGAEGSAFFALAIGRRIDVRVRAR